MFQKRLAVIVLAYLLAGCACTTKPSMVPVIAPETKAPPPAALMTLPVPPEPLEPGYSRTH